MGRVSQRAAQSQTLTEQSGDVMGCWLAVLEGASEITMGRGLGGRPCGALWEAASVCVWECT